MSTVELWIATHGLRVAGLLDAQREPICAAVRTQLIQAFPTLCLDPARPDALAFQQTMLTHTPNRLHALLQSGLRLRSLNLIEREYRWLWGLMPRYQVEPKHLLATAGWYFQAARVLALPEAEDRPGFDTFKRTVLQLIRRVTAPARALGEPAATLPHQRRTPPDTMRYGRP